MPRRKSLRLRERFISLTTRLRTTRTPAVVVSPEHVSELPGSYQEPSFLVGARLNLDAEDVLPLPESTIQGSPQSSYQSQVGSVSARTNNVHIVIPDTVSTNKDNVGKEDDTHIEVPEYSITSSFGEEDVDTNNTCISDDSSEDSATKNPPSEKIICSQVLTNNDITEGNIVKVNVGHKRHGEQGVVYKVTKCFVFFDTAKGDRIQISPKFVSQVGLATSTTTESAPNSSSHQPKRNKMERLPDSVASVQFTDGDFVEVSEKHRKHSGKKGVVDGSTTNYIYVKVFAKEKTIERFRILPASLIPLTGDLVDVSLDSGSSVLPMDQNSTSRKSKTLKIIKPSRQRLKKMVYTSSELEKSLFSEIWKGKHLLLEYEIPFGRSHTISPLNVKLQHEGKSYELYYADVIDDSSRSLALPFVKANKIVAYYVPTENLCYHEECLASFGHLHPRKVWARRRLFLSEAIKLDTFKPAWGFSQISSSDIEIVKDFGTVGCGFISERFMEALLGGGAAAKRTIGVQVRIHVPTVGVFKGMLVRKNDITGPPIQVSNMFLLYSHNHLLLTYSFAVAESITSESSAVKE